ncbi:hypothetical protein ENBRE01_0242 [Enteropsectra breve]|nr:hypothetical protein ENBRE01_0242 [Enteropsectra breve]
MNGKMHEILKKQAIKKCGDEIVFEDIQRPQILKPAHPSMYNEASFNFYSFDGREMIFNKNTNNPVISLPEETKKLVACVDKGETHLFMLNTSNKLEHSLLKNNIPGEKTVVSRNVVDIGKTGNRMFYTFKKDSSWYINEISCDNGKWIGKNILTNIKSDHIELFCVNNTFYFTNNGILCDFTGNSWMVRADMMYAFSDIIILGTQSEEEVESGSNQFCIELRNTARDMETQFYVLKEGPIVFKGIKHFFVLQNGTNIFVYRIELAVLHTVYVKKYNSRIYDFSLHLDAKGLTVIVLLDNENAPLPENTEESVHESISSALQDYQQIKIGLESQKSSQPIKTSRSTESSHSEQGLSKNVLLAEFKESLEKQKEECKSALNSPLENNEETSSDIHEYEGHMNMDKSKIETEIQKIYEKFAKLSTSEKSLTKKGESTKEEVARERGKDASMKMPRTSAKASGPGKSALPVKVSPITVLEAPQRREEKNCSESISRDKNYDGILTDDFCGAVRDAIIRNDSLIKDVIMKAIVPPIEAALAEMRIQILAEFKKLDFGPKIDPSVSAFYSFKKMLATGKINAALGELLKLKDSDIELYLVHISPGSIENADANLLAVFVYRLVSLLKKGYVSVQRILYECLLDTEVSELSAENLQTLSSAIRTLKNMELNSAELALLLEITSKKIQKRIAVLK